MRNTEALILTNVCCKAQHPVFILKLCPNKVLTTEYQYKDAYMPTLHVFDEEAKETSTKA